MKTPVWGAFPSIRSATDLIPATEIVQWERMEERYLALSAIAWNTQHWLYSLSLVITEQDIKTHQQLKKKKKKRKSQIEHEIIITLIINKKLKVVDCSLEIHGLFKIWLPTKAGWCCITKPHVDSTQFNVVDYNYWLFGWHWTSRYLHIPSMACTVGLGPLWRLSNAGMCNV